MREDAGANGTEPADEKLSRRGFLAGGLGAAATVAALGVGLDACSPSKTSTEIASGNEIVPFYGTHQAGIATAAQPRLIFATFDVVATDRDDLAGLLRVWTTAAAAMTRGQPVPGPSDNLNVPAADTGEAQGLEPGHLTVTIGYGPSLFDARFGLASRRPRLLATLPPLPNEHLDPAYVGGDIALQVCSDDPIVAFHALRDLARIGIGTVVLRWMEIGFASTARTTAKATPRNLLGFKDGTRNIDGADASLMDKWLLGFQRGLMVGSRSQLGLPA
jgi:deferrochelatase/peroxidase EfeB